MIYFKKERSKIMIIGVMGDTHKDVANIIPFIIEAFMRARVELIIHTGDIESQHLKSELFRNIPVICALTDNQEKELAFQFPPPGWTFTFPGKRIKRFKNFSVYVGHKRFYELLRKKESDFRQTLELILFQTKKVYWLSPTQKNRDSRDVKPEHRLK